MREGKRREKGEWKKKIGWKREGENKGESLKLSKGLCKTTLKICFGSTKIDILGGGIF